MSTDLIDKWATYHATYNGVTPKRIADAKRALERLVEHAGKPLTAVDGQDLRDFLAAQVAGGRHVNTVRQYRALVRPFFTWGWETGVIDADTLLRIRAVPPPAKSTGRSTPRPYNKAELARLREAIAKAHPLLDEFTIARRMKLWSEGKMVRWYKLGPHTRHIQLEAVVALALEMGLRAGEIYDLEVDELHYDNEFVVVQSKLSRPREVPFSSVAREAVRQWIEMRTRIFPDIDHTKPWLHLQTRSGVHPADPMSTPAWKRIMPTGWELHRLRHTCATERLRAGMPLEAVMRLLGHASLSQTLAYAEIARPDILRHIERTQDGFSEAVGDGG